MSHEVTDEFDLIDIVIKQFNAGKFYDEFTNSSRCSQSSPRSLMRCD